MPTSCYSLSVTEQGHRDNTPYHYRCTYVAQCSHSFICAYFVRHQRVATNMTRYKAQRKDSSGGGGGGGGGAKEEKRNVRLWKSIVCNTGG